MYQANNLSQFLGILDKYSNYKGKYYRGQLSKYETIISSVSRNSGLISNEFRLYSESQALKQDEFKDITTPIDYLAKMQHYGIPTRLIDFTVDPLVALFFSVQNIDVKSDSIVYVFIRKGLSKESKHVRLLSLLAKLINYDIPFVQKQYFAIYNEIISHEEIIDYSSKPAFIGYEEEINYQNNRIRNQKGTFVICCNTLNNGLIQHHIEPLNDIPTVTIRIPHEYKKLIKQELDEKYSINDTYIYPELPSVATYLIEKYKDNNFSYENEYTIVNSEDVSVLTAKRISIVVVLEKSLHIQHIKDIGRRVIDKYAKNYDVVWVYIAKSFSDYTISNWIITGQWISSTLKNKPNPIGVQDTDGYFWSESDSYTAVTAYFEGNVFEEDKKLFVLNIKTFSTIKSAFDKLNDVFRKEDFEKFKLQFNSQKELIDKTYSIFSEFGLSRDKNFSNFLSNFSLATCSLSNISHWIERTDLKKQSIKYQVKKCLIDVEEHLNRIENESIIWKENLNVTDKDFDTIHPSNISKTEFHYNKTLPIDPNAIIVTIDLDIHIDSDNTIQVKGDTNLFDKANLLLSIKNGKGKIYGQSNADVLNGFFNFGKFSIRGKGYDTGLYYAEVSLSIPNTQHKDFVKRSGIEYENLTGSLIDRTGIGPTLNYIQTFEIS